MADNLSIDEVKGLKVQELRNALQDRGLDTKGVKGDLVKRLEEALEAEASGSTTSAAAASTTDAHKSNDDASAPTESDMILLSEADSPSTTPSAALSSSGTPSAGAAESVDGSESLLSIDKRRERANRFNIPVVRSEEEVLAERAKRFGIVSEDEKLQQRKLKFGIVTEDDKKAQRAKRFGASEGEEKKPAKLSTTASRLDSALPDRRPKRGRNGANKKKKAQSPKKPRAQQ